MSEPQAAPAQKQARASTRGAGVIGALLLVVGLLLIVTGVIARTRVFGASGGSGNGDQRATATALRARAEQALTTAARALEPKAMAASRLPEIVSGLDLDADVHTFEDLLENEDWWAPYRTEFALSGLVTGAGAVATIGSGGVDLGGASVVRQAREGGVASGAAAAQGRAFMVAAARVPRGKHASGAVVILGAPLERSALQAVADGAGTAVALSDGKRLLASAGPDAGQTTLAALVGREDRAGEAGIVTLDDARAGLAVALDRGLWLDVVLPRAPPPAGTHLGLLIAAAGALLGAAGLIIQLSGRRRAHKVDTDNPMVITRPMGSGQRPRPPIKQQIERTKDLHPPAHGAFAPGAEVAPRGGAAAAAAVLETPPAGAGVTLGRYRLLERIGEGGMAEIFIATAHGAEGFVRSLRRQADAPAPGAQPRRRQPVHRRGPAAVRPRALEHRARVRLRARRRGVLPGARVHPRPRPGTAGAPARRGVRPVAQRAGRLLHHARGDGGARLRARARPTPRAATWRLFTATSRRATSWCRRAAR